MLLANPFKDFEWSNVPRVKLSSFSKTNDTFSSLQALSNLHYFLSGFMNYFWSCVKVKPPVVTKNSHPPGNKTTSYANVAKASCDVGNKGSICVDKECGDQTQVISIPMSSSQDLPLAVLGCYKDFRSIANARSLCNSEGFLDVSFKYLGGLWLLFEFNSLEARNSFLKHDEIEGVPIRAWEDDVFKSICNKWGEVIFSDDFDLCNRLCKRVCIKSKHNQLVFATIFVTLMNVTYAIRVCELCSWTPTFVEIDSDREDDEMQGNNGTDVVSVGGLSVDVNGEVQINADDIHDQAEEANVPSSDHEPQQHDLDSDPFGLEPLINKKVGTKTASQSSVTPMFPPGFSPLPDDDVTGHSDTHHCIKPPDSESSHSSHGVNNKQIGFSMIERLEETIKIGTALGLNMEGCENTLATLIANNGEFKGEVIFSDDSDLCNRLCKRVCIKSKHNQLVFATIFMTLMNVTYAIRVCGLCSWTPTFVEIDSDREDDEMQGNDGTDVVSVGGLSVDSHHLIHFHNSLISLCLESSLILD
nr:RNA-directed DNA polymerase, eukaryota [Tanacetum cinerariifolium]